MGLPQFGPCVIRVSGAGPCRAGAIWGLERSAEWMREEQPEVEPYCACESCACCGSVAVRRVGERAWPGGPCRVQRVRAGRVRARGRGFACRMACVVRAASACRALGPGPEIVWYGPNRVCVKFPRDGGWVRKTGDF